MKISELANIGGVSVRTVRHYHDIGLMPEPAKQGPWRDYGIDDIVLLLRIRTFAEAGVPLTEVRDIICEGDTRQGTPSKKEKTQATIDATIHDIDMRIAQLQARRTQLEHLRITGEYRSLAKLPPGLSKLYDSFEYSAIKRGAKRELNYVRLERKFVEVLIRIGLFDKELLDWFEHHALDFDPDLGVNLYSEFAELDHPHWSKDDVNAFVDRMYREVFQFNNMSVAVARKLSRFANSRLARALSTTIFHAPAHKYLIEEAARRFNEECRAYIKTERQTSAAKVNQTRPHQSAQPQVGVNFLTPVDKPRQLRGSSGKARGASAASGKVGGTSAGSGKVGGASAASGKVSGTNAAEVEPGRASSIHLSKTSQPFQPPPRKA